MSVRPFKLYGESELSLAAERVAAVIRAWLEKWTTIDPTLLHVEVAPCSEQGAAQDPWKIAAASAESSIALSAEPEWLRLLPALLTGQEGESPQPGSLGSALADDVLRDLFLQLLGHSGVKVGASLQCRTAAIPRNASRDGSGFLCVIANLANDRQLRLLFWPDVAGHFSARSRSPGTRAALRTAEQALERRPVKLEVAIGEAELTLDELQTLAIGDVIPLKRGLHEALTLQMDSTTPVCRGYLGRVRGQVALQISQK